MITIRTRYTVKSGRTVESIVRSWYGPTATVRWSTEGPVLAEIVKPVDRRKHYKSDAVQVIDTLISIEDSK